MTLLRVFIIFMIVASVVAVESRRMISSVIAIGTVGLCLMLSFMLLRAPDLAVILLIVEIVTLSAVVFVTTPEDDIPRSWRDAVPAAAAAAFALLLLAAGWRALAYLPAFGDMHRQIIFSIPGNHQGPYNLVTVLAAGFRSLDSLGSIAVLCAVAAGSVLLLNKERGDKR